VPVPASSVAVPAEPVTAAAEVTQLKVRWDGARVRQGKRYVVTGKVGGGPRPVLVQRRIPGGWFTLGRDSAGADGRFRITVNTRWVIRHRSIRAFAPATATHDAASVLRKGGVSVTIGYRPRGGKAWRPIKGGGSKGQRWTPCGLQPGVITYRVNPKGLPRGGLREVKKAFGKVTATTGFSFRYLGKTKHVPLKKGSSEISPDADITIAYASPRKVPALRGPVVATTPVAAGFVGTPIYRIIEAGVVIDRTYRARPGFGPGRPTRGLTLIHELGHAVGLDHVRDRRQVMYPAPTRNAAAYAKGDLRGLKKVGVSRGCFPGEALGRPAPASPTRVRVTLHKAESAGPQA
jgi:hypothetical protein